MIVSVIKMEFKVLFFVVCMYFRQTKGVVSAISLKQLSEKIDLFETILEKKLDFEIAQRQRDYEHLMSKLGDITKQIETLKDKSTITANGKYSEEQKISVIGTTDSGKSEELLKYLINGIKTEKQLNGVIRREMSRMGRALNDLNTRVTREVSCIDLRVTDSNYQFIEEHFNNLSSSIENGHSMILSSQNDTRRILRNELRISTSQLDAAEEERYDNLSIVIENGISKILTTSNESRAELLNEMKQCLRKHVNATDITTETSNAHICSNMSASSEKIQSNFKSCKDALTKGHQTSGVYTVHDIKVYCDQTTEGGGWTVFQRRMDGSVDFYRDWDSYKQGFGDVSREFWLGNDYLSKMLGRGNHELRIDLKDFEGNRAYARYSSFRIDPESNDYTLHVSGFSGNAGDSLKYHNGYAFSTKDMDLDKYSGSCAKDRKGAWWYNSCNYSNLNGLYQVPPGNEDGKNVVWYYWKNTLKSLKFVEMKFRQNDGT